MAYGSGLLGDFWSGYGQRRAASGRPLTAREMSGLLTPLLDYSSAEARAAGEREMRQAELDRQYALQKEQQESAKKSGLANAVAQGTGLAASTGLGIATLGQQAENAAATRALAERLYGLNPSMPNAVPNFSAPYTPSGILGTPGAANGGVVPTTTAANSAGAAPAATTAANGTTLSETGTVAAPGASSLAGSIASGAGAVYAAHSLGAPLLKQLGVPEHTAEGFSMTGAPGAIGGGIRDIVGGDVGKIAQYAIDPIGSAVNSAINAIEDLF